MKRVEIPELKRDVSRIFLGTAIPQMLAGGDADAILGAALDAGVDAIDTARGYGDAEKSLAKWFRACGTRARVTLLSKCCNVYPDGRNEVTPARIRREMDASLQALGSDHVDVYLLHRDDPSTPAGVFVETMNELLRAGKCRSYGASNWTHRRLQEANDYAAAHGLVPMALSSPHYGLVEQVRDPWGGDCVTVTGATSEPARRWYAETRMPLLAYSSLGRGFFSGRVDATSVETAAAGLDEFAQKGYLCEANLERLRRAEQLAKKLGVPVARVAMAWLLQSGLNTLAVVSTTRPERVAENLAAFDLELDAPTRAWLNLESMGR